MVLTEQRYDPKDVYLLLFLFFDVRQNLQVHFHSCRGLSIMGSEMEVTIIGHLCCNFFPFCFLFFFLFNLGG